MYQFFKGLKANYLISAILCVLFGITLIVWPDISSQVVCIGLGCVLLLSGIIHLVSFFAQRDGTLVSRIGLLTGIILVAVGIWIVTSPSVLMVMIPVIIGVIIVLHGIHNITQAVSLCRSKYSKWWVALILGVLTVLFGVLLIFNPFEAVSTAVVVIGVLLVFDGISDIWIISRVSRTARSMKETMDALTVDDQNS